MRIYIDATGGDNAPVEIIEGAKLAYNEYKVPITLLAHTEDFEKYIGKELVGEDKISLIEVTEDISMHDEPAGAIRRKKDSAIVKGMALVKGVEDVAFISAGSTGAVLTGATLLCGRIPNVARPALGVILPGKKPTLLIDNGANADCKPEYLLTFAKMGSVYLKGVLGIDSPTVALANIGTEDTKGSTFYKETFTLLKNDDTINFKGNIEMKTILAGDADVVVCDGFTGNIILKTIEGTFSFTLSLIKEVLTSSLLNKLAAAIIYKPLKERAKTLDPSNHGGVPLLGVNANVIKAHGSSDRVAVMNAVRQAITLVENQTLAKIKDILSDKEE